MSLELLMENTHAKPGLNRAGMIIIHAPNEKTITAKAFFVRLLGVSKTRISTSEDHIKKIHESSAVFLEIRKDLRTRPTVLEDGLRCQFQFRFPEDPTAKSRFPDMLDLNWTLELPQPQALPPSGNFGSGNTIAYKFEVILIDENSDRHIKADQDFTFSVTREVQLPNPKMIITVQKRPFDGRAGLAGSQHLNLALECAIEHVQGEPLSLWLKLVDRNEPSSAKVLLKSSTVQLIEKTAIQGDNHLENQWTDKYVIASRVFERDLPTITTQATNLGALLHDPRIPLDHPPTFSCINIQCTYGMSILLLAEIEGCRTLEFQFDLDSVTLLPAEHSDTAWKKEVEEVEANDPIDPSSHRRRFAGL